MSQDHVYVCYQVKVDLYFIASISGAIFVYMIYFMFTYVYMTLFLSFVCFVYMTSKSFPRKKM